LISTPDYSSLVAAALERFPLGEHSEKEIIGKIMQERGGNADPTKVAEEIKRQATIEGLEGVNRAPHMERYTRVRPYRTEEHRDGHKVELVIGVQGFNLSDGVGNHHESRAAAEWCRRQLCLALDVLRSEVIEECARHLCAMAQLEDIARSETAGTVGVAVSPKTVEWERAAEAIRAMKGGVK